MSKRNFCDRSVKQPLYPNKMTIFGDKKVQAVDKKCIIWLGICLFSFFSVSILVMKGNSGKSTSFCIKITKTNVLLGC